MTNTEMVTCSPSCKVSLQEDRRHGLIYGPYALMGADGKAQIVSQFEFAGHSGDCVYCGGPLPRGRAKRILKVVAKILKAERGVSA